MAEPIVLYPVAAVAREAVQHLQRRLDDARNFRLRLGGEGFDASSSALIGAGGALEALREVGLISEEEAVDWNARFIKAITGETIPLVALGTAVAVSLPGVEGAEMPLPSQPFQSIGFRRLIPGPDDERKLGPGVLRILALVVFEDGVEVDWLYSMPPNADTFVAERNAVAEDLDELPLDERVRRLRNRDHYLRWSATPHDFSLSDDVGTVDEMQCGGSGGYVTMRGQHGFVPTLPPEATRVDVDAHEVRFTVAVA